MLNISGSGVALVTPFTKNNTINYDKVNELMNYHIQNNTDFVVICGTTGESSTLSIEEKKKLIKYVVENFKGKIPIIAGTGTNDTYMSTELSKFAKKEGVDGILVVTPYYNKANDDGLFIHYSKIAKAVSNLPVILYNVPSRTGIDITVENIVKLSKIDNIIGIKEASSSLEKIAKIINMTKDSNFKVFSGNDNLTLPILSLGGSGVISVCANIIPKQMHEICTNLDKDLFFEYLDLMNVLTLDINPIMIKTAMNYIGFDVGDLRLPLHITNNENIAKMKRIIDEKL